MLSRMATISHGGRDEGKLIVLITTLASPSKWTNLNLRWMAVEIAYNAAFASAQVREPKAWEANHTFRSKPVESLWAILKKDPKGLTTASKLILAHPSGGRSQDWVRLGLRELQAERCKEKEWLISLASESAERNECSFLIISFHLI